MGSSELAPTDCAFVTFVVRAAYRTPIWRPVVLEGASDTSKTTQETLPSRVREIATWSGRALKANVTVEITRK
jgi:hypothetical protein